MPKLAISVALTIAAALGGCPEPVRAPSTRIDARVASAGRTPAGRTPAYLRKHGNRLRQERSAYLRQHAHNPLDWYPWGKAALERARRERKPIFLSIGYASCHWCHVMEREVFEDDEVARFMNEHFVSIKVDREERPDLDAVYMQAVQAISGNGGWPMSVFLTPELKPFFGGSYFPRDRFLALARRLSSAFRDRREQVEGQAAKLHAMLSAELKLSGGGAVAADDINALVVHARASFDTRWGGFRGRMKFPIPPRWRFLLHSYRKSGDTSVGLMLRTTLDNMGSGGIHDHIGGGFHRYTVEPTWVVPHRWQAGTRAATLPARAGPRPRQPRPRAPR